MIDMAAYILAAERFGNVSPQDLGGVDVFFRETLPTLSSDKQEEILEFLLDNADAESSPSGESARRGIAPPRLSATTAVALRADLRNDRRHSPLEEGSRHISIFAHPEQTF